MAQLDYRHERHSQDTGSHERAGPLLRPWRSRADRVEADPEGPVLPPNRDPTRDRREGGPHRQDHRRGDAALPPPRAREGASGRSGRGAGGDPGGAGGVARLVHVGVRAAGGGIPQGRRPARHAVPPDRERRDHARPIEDGTPSGDRLGLRADRFLPLQPPLRGAPVHGATDLRDRHLELSRLSAPRGVRVRDHAVQLHLDRRQPADSDAVATGIVRGAYEYQGQKCSAASRAYVPDAVWPRVRDRVLEMLAEVKMGDPADFRNFVGAVIDRKAFDKIKGYIEAARQAPGVKILAGGRADDTDGYFIEPTLIQADDPGYRTMREEVFGPVLTVHVYPAARWADTLRLVDETTPYALTGAVFAQDRRAVDQAQRALRYAAGNFYVNDKPTGAVVGQQPFGGARASGTNDKAGSLLNLIRWVSPRAVQENFLPPRTFTYPFMAES